MNSGRALLIFSIISDNIPLKLESKLKTKQNPKIKKSEITVGCDTEFEAFSLNERRVVYATYGDTSSEVGIDGAGECVELS